MVVVIEDRLNCDSMFIDIGLEAGASDSERDVLPKRAAGDSWAFGHDVAEESADERPVTNRGKTLQTR